MADVCVSQCEQLVQSFSLCTGFCVGAVHPRFVCSHLWTAPCSSRCER